MAVIYILTPKESIMDGQLNSDWPYGIDGVSRDEPANRYRFPLVTTMAPRWNYISAVVVTDAWFGGLRPTDEELVIIASWHEAYCDYWYGDNSFRHAMRQRPFDIDGGANGRLLIKHAPGSWSYRHRSWTQGPAFMPLRDRFLRWLTPIHSSGSCTMSFETEQDLVHRAYPAAMFEALEVGGVLDCGCPVDIVDDEGHQEGCAETVVESPPLCGRPWVAEIELCPRCGQDAWAHRFVSSRIGES